MDTTCAHRAALTAALNRKFRGYEVYLALSYTVNGLKLYENDDIVIIKKQKNGGK